MMVSRGKFVKGSLQKRFRILRIDKKTYSKSSLFLSISLTGLFSLISSGHFESFVLCALCMRKSICDRLCVGVAFLIGGFSDLGGEAERNVRKRKFWIDTDRRIGNLSSLREMERGYWWV